MVENKDKKTVLLTGLTGFIGRNTARKIYHDFDITALVRPNTEKSRYEEFINHIKIVEIDLADNEALTAFLSKTAYDYILHIGALRGGRRFNKEIYFKANIEASEALIKAAVQFHSKLIFCSSVGVYGAIPASLPATLDTPFKEDNYYHITKIQCEKMIYKAISENGLQACIVRPAITYGMGDYGFPYTLTKLVSKKLLFLPKEDIYIHLLNVETLSEIFSRLLDGGFVSGKAWNVADREKVCFRDLVDFINNKTYPRSRFINKVYFSLFTKIARMLKNELWVSRFELISNSWYFDVDLVYEDLSMEGSNTIPEFDSVINWYKGL
jgi:nucleoside-diphosphate-sugar epimerase